MYDIKMSIHRGDQYLNTYNKTWNSRMQTNIWYGAVRLGLLLHTLFSGYILKKNSMIVKVPIYSSSEWQLFAPGKSYWLMVALS